LSRRGSGVHRRQSDRQAEQAQQNQRGQRREKPGNDRSPVDTIVTQIEPVRELELSTLRNVLPQGSS
jgi:hypothetical protein